MTTIAFSGTKEQKADLDALIAKYKNVEGNFDMKIFESGVKYFK